MTKRFTPKARTYTVRLATVQAKLAALKPQVQALGRFWRGLLPVIANS